MGIRQEWQPFFREKGLTAGEVPCINPGFVVVQGLSRKGKPFSESE